MQPQGQFPIIGWVVISVATFAAGWAVGKASVAEPVTYTEARLLRIEPRESVAFPGRWYFGPYRCQDYCEGHAAGFTWAAAENVTLEDDCGGSGSDSFLEGCLYYLEIRGLKPDVF